MSSILFDIYKELVSLERGGKMEGREMERRDRKEERVEEGGRWRERKDRRGRRR